MRAIVRLFKLVIGLLFIIGFGAGLLLLLAGLGQPPETASRWYAIFGGIALVVFVPLSVGLTATFISMHDRICELTEAANYVAQAEVFSSADASGEDADLLSRPIREDDDLLSRPRAQAVLLGCIVLVVLVIIFFVLTMH